MDHDLSRSLRDLSTAADMGDGHLPVDQILRRVHRRRARTAATYSAVGLTAATALVLGGVTFANRLDEPDLVPVVTPTPSATPTPTTTATPSPTPSATPTVAAEAAVLPAPTDWTIPWDLCGQRFDEENVDAALAGAEVRAQVAASTLQVGQALDAEVAIDWTGTQPFEVRFDGLVAVARGGATIGLPSSAPQGVRITPSGSTSASVALPTALVSCVGADGSADDGAPLAAGPYSLALLYTVIAADGTQTQQMTGAGSVEVTGSGGAVQPTTGTSVVTSPAPLRVDAGMDQGACGETVDGTGTVQPDVSYPFDLRGTASLVDGQLVASITALNTGRHLRSTSVSYPEVMVVRDGRVIGRAAPGGSELPVADWPTGGELTTQVSLGLHTCTFMRGEPWPAGTYELYAYQWGSVMAEGGPWTFTLD